MKKRYMRGSFTVEASIVVSMTILVLASLILCTFYIHDRAVFQSMVCEAVSAGSNFATESERSAAVSEAADRVRAERFLGSRDVSGSAEAGDKQVTASWNASYPVPGFAVRYLAEDSWGIRKSWTCRVLDPADVIRKIKGAGELLTGGNDN